MTSSTFGLPQRPVGKTQPCWWPTREGRSAWKESFGKLVDESCFSHAFHSVVYDGCVILCLIIFSPFEKIIQANSFTNIPLFPNVWSAVFVLCKEWRVGSMREGVRGYSCDGENWVCCCWWLKSCNTWCISYWKTTNCNQPATVEPHRKNIKGCFKNKEPKKLKNKKNNKNNKKQKLRPVQYQNWVIGKWNSLTLSSDLCHLSDFGREEMEDSDQA